MKEAVERKEEEEVSVGDLGVSGKPALSFSTFSYMCSPSLLICLSLSLLDLPEEMQQRYQGMFC